MIIINDTFEIKGGSHTLMLRICRWAVKHEHDITFLYNKGDNKSIINEIINAGGHVTNVGGDRIENLTTFFKSVSTKDLQVISFSWNYYMEVEIVKKKLRLRFDNKIYCIIPDTFEKGRGISNRIFRDMLRIPYKGILKRMNENNAVIMMDEVCKERTEKWNGFKLLERTPMIRLPISFPDNDNYENDIRDGYNSNIIFTASRADFMFKGYLIGLVDDFVRIKGKFADAKLIIIASGKDEETLKNKIKSVPDKIREDITLIPWISYDELLQRIRKCKFFIGMSSTLLDAAKLYKICIPIRGYTEENLASGFFDEDPRYLYASDDCQSSALPLMEECMGWNFEEYHSRSLSHYDAVKSLYDEDKNIKSLIEEGTKNKTCILNNKDRFIHELYIKKARK